MKQRLMRPTAALFPLVGFAGSFVGNGPRDFILLVFIMYYIVQIISLCSADSFRNAAAQEPGVRRVDRRFGGALIPLAFGIAVALAMVLLLRPLEPGDADHAAFFFDQMLRAGIAASLISIEHLFEERMFALGRRVDGVVLSCVSNGLLFAGMLLDAAGEGSANSCFLGAAALGAGISVIANYLIEPIHGFSLAPRNLSFAPRACLQTLLYPVVAVAEALLLSNSDGEKLDAMLSALLFGLIPWRLARTVARRSADESRPLNLLLIVFAAVPAILASWFPGARAFALTAMLALVCAAAVFCAPGKRLYIGVALIVAAGLPISYPFYINIILVLAAVVINLKQAFLRRI